MTDSPSEAEVMESGEGTEGVSASDVSALAEELGALVGATAWSDNFGVIRLEVERDNWVAAAAKLRGRGLELFSWLSAIDWSREVEVGEQVESPDDLDERFEVLCRLSSVKNADAVHLVAVVPKDDAQLPSLVGEFAGAEWHEREAAEMFGIDFPGNPAVDKHLYLPDAFEGNPLLKSFPLLSREVKPWPGTVDVEDMPTTENVEAAQDASGETDGGDE
ncbi:MAG: NADH-quinone oxidoreductase subunit C [bacterium]|nr:NADH-quinone oxidoreductase subunit C [bacterium]